jgi:hypothetical protein
MKIHHAMKTTQRIEEATTFLHHAKEKKAKRWPCSDKEETETWLFPFDTITTPKEGRHGETRT